MPLIGVFAARGPNRPNPIGVSACEIVELGPTWLSVRGLDAVDRTRCWTSSPSLRFSSRTRPASRNGAGA